MAKKTEEKVAAEQPVPAEKLKDFYIVQLELQNGQNQLNEQARQANERFAALWKAHGVNPEEWMIDLRRGVMTRKDKGPSKDPAYRGPRRPRGPKPEPAVVEAKVSAN